MKTLEEMLTAVRREIVMRQRVYPAWILKGKMKQDRADHEIRCMVDLEKFLVQFKEASSMAEKPAAGQMTDDEFNALLKGPLHHPIIMFCITRLTLALRAVVDATGKPGIEALRWHCREREIQDLENVS